MQLDSNELPRVARGAEPARQCRPDGGRHGQASFPYAEAFSRNIGIVSEQEQARLRHSRVAIAGLGGVGGQYALSLARAGVASFSLCDGDDFEIVNSNRQAGCLCSTHGKNKAEAIARQILDINPDADIRTLPDYLTPDNIAEFLAGAALVLNAIDIFSVPAHRLLYAHARARGLPVLFAAPLGLTAAMLCFDPSGMPADAYFDWHNGQPDLDQTINLLLGTAPGLLHMSHIDMRSVDLGRRLGPSNISACLLCAGLIVTESMRRLLHWPGGKSAPHFMQVDALGARLKHGCLPGGNRGLLQRFKRWMFVREYRRFLQAARQQAAAQPCAGMLGAK